MKTYKDIYVFPLRKSGRSSWVYDQKGNFVFQFEPKFDEKGNYADGYKEFEEKVIKFLNGESVERKSKNTATVKNGEILLGDVHVITIRGWGNLTGCGAHNLPAEEAANIQDTFAEFIVDRLNER